MNPSISILLPVYNGAATLVPAIRSLLSQDYADFELLLLDDGSTDGGVEAAHGLSDARIRIVQDGNNRGLAARLNQGIDLAKGRYFARMDQDDLAMPNRLSRQLMFLESNPEVDLVSSRAIVFSATDKSIIGMLPYRNGHMAITAQSWRGIHMAHPTWMGRAPWFRRHRYWIPEVNLAEDQELLLRALPESRYHTLEDVLLAYRRGSFVLFKTLRARRSLLGAQARIFAQRRQWAYLLLAVLSTMLKVGVDAAAALPGCGFLFFARLRGTIPEGVAQRFSDLLVASGES